MKPENLMNDMITELGKFIVSYESDTFSGSGAEVNEPEAQRMAVIIVRNYFENRVDGTVLQDAFEIVRPEDEDEE